jgi:hypothetical protein
MSKTILGLIATLAATAANAQSVTYDFTGVVTSSDFGSVATGMTVKGSYTIDLGNADLSGDGMSDNTIGYLGPWLRGVAGGTAYSMPVPSGTVFSSTLSAGAFNYASSGPSPFGSDSYIAGAPGYYTADDREYTRGGIWFTDSSFMLNGAMPYDLNGLPLFSSGIATGSFGYERYVSTAAVPYNQGPQFNYAIKSVTRLAAPEIDPISAGSSLTLILGAMAVLRGRRRT